MTLGLTAASAVGGLVVGGTAERPLLLAIVIVGPLLGFLFLDHAQTVDALGDHIRETLAPVVRNAVRQLASDQRVVSQAELVKLLAWEDEVRERRRMARWRGLIAGPSLLPYAIVPAASALLVSNTDGALSPAVYWVLWSVGVFLIVLYFVLWLVWVVKYR